MLKRPRFFILMLLIALFCGCAKTQESMNTQEVPNTQESINNKENSISNYKEFETRKQKTPIMFQMFSKKYYLYSTGESGEPKVFYKYDIETKETKEIGEINDLYITKANFVTIGEKMYSYYSSTEEGVKMLEVDLKQNKVEIVDVEKNMSGLIYMEQLDNKVLSLKSKEDGKKNLISYIEEYTPQTKEKRKLITTKFDLNNEKGKYIINFTESNNKIYLLVEETIKNIEEIALYVYDNKGILIEKNTFEEKVEGLGEKMISQIQVANDYVFIEIFLGKSFLGKIKDGKIKSVEIEGEELHLFGNDGNTNPNYILFYPYGTNKIYIVDGKKNQVREKQISIPNSNNLIVTAKIEESDNIMVVLDYIKTSYPKTQTIERSAKVFSFNLKTLLEEENTIVKFK